MFVLGLSYGALESYPYSPFQLTEHLSKRKKETSSPHADASE